MVKKPEFNIEDWIIDGWADDLKESLKSAKVKFDGVVSVREMEISIEIDEEVLDKAVRKIGAEILKAFFDPVSLTAEFTKDGLRFKWAPEYEEEAIVEWVDLQLGYMPLEETKEVITQLKRRIDHLASLPDEKLDGEFLSLALPDDE